MKTILTVLAVFGMVLVGVAAQDITNLLTLSASGTNNSLATSAGAFMPARLYYVRCVGITNTNSVTITAQRSIDGTNRAQYATFHPSGTNGAVELFTANPNPVLESFDVQVVSTNGGTVTVDELIPAR